MNRMKVLIIAYACNPTGTSEPAIGWNFIRQISKYCDLSVLTRNNERDSITSFIADANDPDLINIKWFYYDLPDWVLYLKKRVLGIQLYFKLWQWGAYRKYKKSFKTKEFNIINHLNFGINWMPSPFYKLGDNFVWGPVGGGDIIPWPFLRKERLFCILRETCYRIIIAYGKYLSLSNRKCRDNSKAVLFRTNSVLRGFPLQDGKTKKYVVCETGCQVQEVSPLNLDFDTIHAIAVSRLDYWKGMIYAVKGFHRFLQLGGKGKLTVIGRGSELRALKQYIKLHKLENFINLVGQLKYAAYQAELRNSNVLIYPSFRDGGSFVVLESMFLGLPIICNSLTGPYEMVTEEAGLIIDSSSIENYIESIGKRLLELQTNPDIGNKKGKSVRLRAEKYYTWEARGKQLFEVYQDVFNAS